MRVGCLGTNEEGENGKTSKGLGAKAFSSGLLENALKIGSGVNECESGGENACRMGIRLI